MLQIIINGQQYQLGTPPPSNITSLSIQYRPHPLQQMGVPRQQIPKIKAWLNQVIKNCSCSHITFNNTLISIEDCTLFPEEELHNGT